MTERTSSLADRKKPFHRGLRRDDVMRAALGLVDAEGRGALTMRRLAAVLDVAAPSLYTHVRKKDDVVDGLLDLVLDTVPLPPLDSSWRRALVGGFSGYRAALLAHPAVVPLIVERGRYSRAQVRLVERSIQLLESAGLTIGQAVEAHVTLVSFTIGFVAQETGRSPDVTPEILATSATLRRAISALLEQSPDERFTGGLSRILDGIAATGAKAS